MELKANERLSVKGIEKIQTYFSKLSELWDVADTPTKIKISHCFRCISNGGRDPTILRCEIREWVPDGYRLKVQDKAFIQKLLRESEALDIIVYEFLVSAKILNYDSTGDTDMIKKDPFLNSEQPEGMNDEMSDEYKETNIAQIINNNINAAAVADTPKITREFSQIMLDLCLDLSEDPASAARMCSAKLGDGAIAIIDKDSKFDPRDHRISFTVELLWNVVDHFLEKAKSENNYLSSDGEDVMNFEQAIHVLQRVLNYVLIDGFRLSDKELRNEILVILAMIAQFPNSVQYFLESGLFNFLITYACIEEVGRDTWFFFSKPVANSRNFSTISDIDLEFKKEVWFTISELLRSNDPDALLCFASSPLLSCMLMYLEQDSMESDRMSNEKSSVDLVPLSTFLSFSAELEEGSSSTSDKSPLQIGTTTLDEKGASSASKVLAKPAADGNKVGKEKMAGKGFIESLPLYKLREFQQLAATFVVHNAPKVQCEFERQQGETRTVALVLRYSQSEMAEHKNLVFNLLILLNQCLINSLLVRSFMEESNAVQAFLYIFQRSDIEQTRAQAVRLISALCSGNNRKCQKQLSSLGGILELIKPVRSFVHNRPPIVGAKAAIKFRKLAVGQSEEFLDPLENPYGNDVNIVVVAILDCFGKAVVGNPENEAEFAEREGVDALLDLLEISSFVVRLQVLRLLSDVLQNKILVAYANAWRSYSTLRSAAQLFCHCWMDEEVRLDSQRRENGVICDIWNPLGNQMWPSEDDDNVDALTLAFTSTDPLLNKTSTLAPSAKSVTVTKLATAILAARNATQSNLPTAICDKALQRDTRIIIAGSLKSLGVYEMYGVRDKYNPLKLSHLYLDGAHDPADGLPGQFAGFAGIEEEKEEAQRSPFSPSPKLTRKQYSFRSQDESNPSYNDNPEQVEGKEGGSSVASSSLLMDMPMLNSSGDLGLTPSDRQVLSMARKYHALREGEWWLKVKRALSQLSVEPIEADLALIDNRLEHFFDAAQAVQMEQMELSDEDHHIRKDTEDHFMGQIIFKKNQQIKAEWLKRNGRTKGNSSNPFNKKK